MNLPSDWTKELLASPGVHLAVALRPSVGMSQVYRHGHVFIPPWKTDEVIFRAEQTWMLRNICLYPTHALTLMETRFARRMKHSWRSDKSRRDAWALMARMDERRTRGAFVCALTIDNYSLLPWQESALSPVEVDWRTPFARVLKGVVLEPGKTLTLRVRNGCQPLTWSVAMLGLEAAHEPGTDTGRG